MIQRRFARLWWGLAVVGLVLAGAGAVWWMSDRDPLHAPARKAWRDQAVQHVQQRAGDPTWIDAELANRAPADAASGGQAWIGDELLVMRNGEWIICQNVCQKQKETGVERDLFIGRGSDGRWYYSTFHFCIDKMVLQIEPQPASLAEFVDGYWLVEFDGRSDDSLEETWTGGPWGEGKRDPNAVP